MRQNLLDEKQRRYKKIDFETRTILIHKVQIERMKIKHAGEQLGLNQSTAKRIIKMYRTEGKITKFKEQMEDQSIEQKIQEKSPEQQDLLKEVSERIKIEYSQVQEINNQYIPDLRHFDQFPIYYEEIPWFSFLFQTWTFFAP